MPDVDLMLKEYYSARGWDPATGRPTSETLELFGLGFAEEALKGV